MLQKDKSEGLFMVESYNKIDKKFSTDETYVSSVF